MEDDEDVPSSGGRWRFLPVEEDEEGGGSIVCMLFSMCCQWSWWGMDIMGPLSLRRGHRSWFLEGNNFIHWSEGYVIRVRMYFFHFPAIYLLAITMINIIYVCIIPRE